MNVHLCVKETFEGKAREGFISALFPLKGNEETDKMVQVGGKKKKKNLKRLTKTSVLTRHTQGGKTKEKDDKYRK